MAFSLRKTTILVFSLVLIAASSLQHIGAMRPLAKEQWVQQPQHKLQLVVQSLQRGPVTGSGSNPCTNIPGRGTGVCKLGGMTVAGNVVHAPPPPPPVFPAVVAEFGVASSAKGAH